MLTNTGNIYIIIDFDVSETTSFSSSTSSISSKLADVRFLSRQLEIPSTF